MIRPAILACCCSLFCFATTAETSCDCDHYPWPKECNPICGARVFNLASTDELKTFLRLEKPLAEKIIQLKQDRPDKKFTSLEDLKPFLLESDYKKLFQGLDNLNSFEAAYLVQKPEKKEDFRNKVMNAKPPV